MWEWRGLRWVSGGARDEWVEVPGKCEWRGLNLGFVSGGVWIWDVWAEGSESGCVSAWRGLGLGLGLGCTRREGSGPLMCEWGLTPGCVIGGVWVWMCEFRGLGLEYVRGVWAWDVWVEGPRPLMCEWDLGLGCENGGAWAWDMRVEGPGPWDVWVEGLVNKSIKARAVQPPPPSTQGEVPTVFRPDQKPLLSNRANHFLLYPKLTVHCGKKFGHF